MCVLIAPAGCKSATYAFWTNLGYKNRDILSSRVKDARDDKEKAKEKSKPVLQAFHDQVLFLKHNLNAQAVASLQTTSTQIDQDVQALIKDMEASINEANSFIAQMKT